MTLLKKILQTLLILLGILCMITVIFSMTARDQWWIRVFDYPRLQIALINLGVLLVSSIALQWKERWVQIYLVLLTLAVMWQGYVLHPYYLPVPPQVPDRNASEPQREFSLLVANILMENQDSQAYLDMVEKHDPDIVLAIEPNGWWTEQLAPLRQQYPYHIEEPQDNHYGMNFYSRFPLSETEIYYFENVNTPMIFTIITLASGDEIEFYGVHPRPPLPENSVSIADKELIQIAHHINETAVRPALVAGDFNDVPWSFTVEKFQDISRLRDIRVGRGFYNSFDAKSPVLRLPIDHIFITPGLGLVELARPIVFSSDHMALFAQFVVDESVQ